MYSQPELILLDPDTQYPAVKILTFGDGVHLQQLCDYQYHTIALISDGKGQITIGAQQHVFNDNSLILLPMEESFSMTETLDWNGVLIRFYPDFFRKHKYRSALPYLAVLFEDALKNPVIQLSEERMNTLLIPIYQILINFENQHIGQYELLMSWVEIFLINVFRLRACKEVSGAQDFLLTTNAKPVHGTCCSYNYVNENKLL